MTGPFSELLAAKRGGRARGLYSVCSAHPLVLEAALIRARDGNLPVLVEATANQVNQFGGYTGMKPADFASRLRARSADLGVPEGRVVFGGDHLGPYPWRAEPAEVALAKAEDLIRAFVAAGAGKLHLDASMALVGDGPDPLDPGLVARRAARLAAVAESETRKLGPSAALPVYVIGTEVPVPGGFVGAEELGPSPTRPDALASTIDLHRSAFADLGLSEAWERVIAVVAQPGVEFDSRSVHVYDSGRARPLVEAAGKLPGLVLEGHSTDYQPSSALRALVADGVALLKVGPALTFALREALFGLAEVETALSGDGDAAFLLELLEAAMRTEPRWWQGYCAEDRTSLLFGLSDRLRYYWDRPEVQAGVEALFASLARRELPTPLLSQYLPGFDLRSCPGGLFPGAQARDLAVGAVLRELERYEAACTGSGHHDS